MAKTSMVIFATKTLIGGDMPKGYHHLTIEQRCQLSALKERGDSIEDIAQTLGVHRSSIYREIHRNGRNSTYDYKQAHVTASHRRWLTSRRKKKMTGGTIALINEKLSLQWSPEQISGWLKKNRPLKGVSHETIYQYIWKDKQERGNLYKHLRHSGKKYNKRSKNAAGRGCIPNRRDIDERPDIVLEKTRLGDWELDTIIGTRNSGAIVSMVERRSRLTRLELISKKGAFEVSEALFDSLYPIKSHVLTLTSDNGKEFAYHEDVSFDLNADFYFAKPYHSWERGLNEHTNGLVRQYFPKSQRFDEITQEEVKKVEFLLNTRPRKVLEFATPLEVFDQLAEGNRFVALET